MIQAIVYTSNAGSTARYAQMLGERTGLPVHRLEADSCPRGAEIFYLGWIMAGRVEGYRTAAKRYRVRALCAVGMGRTGSQADVVRRQNGLPADLPLFTLQGGFDMQKLRGAQRLMMKLMINALRRKLGAGGERTAEEAQMLELLQHGGDCVCAENLCGALEWWNSAQGGRG